MKRLNLVEEKATTWMSYKSATHKHLSIAAGVVPQSSWSFNPIAPALTISCRPSALAEFPWKHMELSCTSIFYERKSTHTLISRWKGNIVEQISRNPVEMLKSSSWSTRPTFPVKPKLRGKSSVDCNISFIWNGAGVQVVARVPSAGPVPPPTSVVMPTYYSLKKWK